MTDIIIRPSRYEDIDEFRQALGSILAEKRFLRAIDLPPLERTQAFFARVLAENLVQFVALKDDRIIGWCDIIPRDKNQPDRAVLGMGVIAQERGKGYGQRLLETALDAARARGIDTIHLDVLTSNDGAVSLYKKAGFVIEREYTSAEKNGEHRLYHMIFERKVS